MVRHDARSLSVSACLSAALSIAFIGLPRNAAASTTTTSRVSLDSSGTQGNARSGATEDGASISNDGRWVAFESDAANLVAGDGNAKTDVFLRDLQTGATTRVSVGPGGFEANDSSVRPVISGDGRWIVFRSAATNLVASDTNGVQDVFANDRTTGTTVRLSVSSSGAQANGASTSAAITTDGRFVAFVSSASNLVAGDTNGVRDVFLEDRDADADGIFDEAGAIAVTRVSVSTAGAEGNGDSRAPAMSSDARFIAFDSSASNLVAGDVNGVADVFVRDRQAGTTVRASVDAGGAGGNGASIEPVISGSGRFVIYQSDATNLVANDTNGATDIFTFDRQTGTNVRVSVTSAGTQGSGASADAAISAGGRFIVFRSLAEDLVAGDANGKSDCFLFDRQTSATSLVSLDSAGAQGNDAAFDPSVSNDGRVFVFASLATNVVSDDTNAVQDVFVRTRGDVVPPVAQCPSPISTPCTGAGTVVTFSATATDDCDPSPTIACVPASGAAFPVGATSVTCTARDATGNSATCSFGVTVVDATPPLLQCPPRITAECTSPSGASVTYGVTATDDCTASPAIVCAPPTGSAFAFGTSHVDCTASDTAGNSTSCTFDVTVVDTTPPAIQCAPVQAIECVGPSGVAVSYTVTATDACDPMPFLTCTPPSGSVFAIGSTTVTCVASDHAVNSVQCSFEVRVVDTTPPVIHCPVRAETDCVEGQGATGTFATTTTDVCDPSPAVACVPPSGSVFPFGTTTVHCSATDASSNVSMCSFDVTVVDTLTLERILPASGTQSGGDLVNIDGCRFTNVADTAVTIGGAAATVVAVATGRVQVRTPAGTGVADVRMTNSNGVATLVGAFTYVDPVIAARFGNVNVGLGDRENVLTINGTAGDARREIQVHVLQPFTVEMAAPSSVTPAPYTLYVWLGASRSDTLTPQPRGLGTMVFPTPLNRSRLPQPNRIFNNVGSPGRLGTPDYPSMPAPSVVFARPTGFTQLRTGTFQGFIQDDGSQIPQHFSITNAVVLQIVP
ncbi:MAG: HYR domain-containing protein [Planctomycetes bacterium]|nr:HYR domain-containing protein [Planctomycetota bacterium]